MSYYYYQKVGGNEKWKPVPDSRLDSVADAMFVTILSVDSPIGDDMDKAGLDAIKYKGPLYFDLDDAESPASTAVNALELVKKLEDLGVRPDMLEIYASGGKGFHILVPEACFLTKPPKAGMAFLPAIYKEMAFNLAVDSLDFSVYTARKGRVLRQVGVKRPNDKYKVPIGYDELGSIAELVKEGKDIAEGFYAQLCSSPRDPQDIANPELAMGLLALFDQCKTKVTKALASRKKAKPVVLPENLPSFEALLRGEGIKSDVGFHPIAMQVAITAHARGMSLETLLAAAQGLFDSHESDGFRYNTPTKRRLEVERMFEYTFDNPCYAFSSAAIVSLLAHAAPDLKGLEVSEEEVLAGMQAGEDGVIDDPYDHAGVTLTERGAFTMTENGPKRILALGFSNITELVSATTNTLSVIEADVNMGGKHLGRKVMDLDSFQSVGNFNKVTMPYGQSFNGSEAQARGMLMRFAEKARKTKNRMYVVSREGLDIVSMPFHEDEEVRKDFLVWADVKSVTPQPSMIDKDVKMKFVGYPDQNGQFRTDLSQAPSLPSWLKEGANKELMREMLMNMLHCQKPAYLGKLIGWTIASHYRMLFHKLYDKFPLLHINGAAGMGKCFAKGTLVLLSDGMPKAVENIEIGDKLLGPDGSVRNVLSLGRGSERMYKVSQIQGDSYTVNESHILSLKGSSTRPTILKDGTRINKGEIANITVKSYLEQTKKTQASLKGWKSSGVNFECEKSVPLDPYILGSWIGDGFSARAGIGKPKTTKLYQYWVDFCKFNSLEYTEGNSGTCDTLYVKGPETFGCLESLDLIKNKHIPEMYMTASRQDRLGLLAGLIDSDGTVNCGGFRLDSTKLDLAKQVQTLAKSLGLRATLASEKGLENNFSNCYDIHHVYITGNIKCIPTLDKLIAEGRPNKDPLVTGIAVTPIGVGDYYGFEIDGDRLFLLEDYTVVHNTEMMMLMCNFHYYLQSPKMLTPTSTLFAVSYAASGSASIPLVLDEFKPSEMSPHTYDRFKLMMRDAYNCRNTERGGGNRENSDYRAVHTTMLSAPICFIAESAESESALMERVVLLTLVKPPVVQTQEYFAKFMFAKQHKELLGIIGGYMAAQIVQRYSTETLREEFDVIYNTARKRLMLQAGEAESLSSDDLSRKSGAKERTVYNYSVVEFGLSKLRNLITNIFPGEFDEVLDQMIDEVYSTVNDIQTQTIPEWLKVLNNLADMTQVDSMAQYFCKEGSDYAIIEYNGKPCLELYARSFYVKYRVYCATSRSKPLFPNDAAFVHALNNLPALEAKGLSHILNVPGGSHILDLDELRGSGFISPE